MTVSDQTGNAVYTGALSSLAFSGGRLEPGDSREYLFSISSPAASLSFELRGVAHPAVGGASSDA